MGGRLEQLKIVKLTLCLMFCSYDGYECPMNGLINDSYFILADIVSTPDSTQSVFCSS